MFFLGIFLAYISNYIRSIRILAVIDSVLLIAGGSIVFLVERKKVFIVLLLLSLCILNMLVVERIVNFRINDEKSKLIKLFNSISFEVYVLHIPIYALLNLLIMISKINIRPGIVSMLIFLLLVEVISFLVYKYIDVYFQKRISKSI